MHNLRVKSKQNYIGSYLTDKLMMQSTSEKKCYYYKSLEIKNLKLVLQNSSKHSAEKKIK